MLFQDALRGLVTKWTSESGVRNLERRLAQICRWAVLKLQGVDAWNGAQGDVERENALESCGTPLFYSWFSAVFRCTWFS